MMGSPVSVVVAKREPLRASIARGPSRFWKHYVANIITALPRNLIAPFLDHLNGIEPSIRFMKEEESNRQLAFLDVLLRRER